MKFRNHLITVAVFSFCLALTACGGGNDDNAGQNPNPNALTAMFFPVQAGDVHELERTNAQNVVEKFQQTVDPAIDMNGTSVFPFTTRDENGQVVHVDYYGTDVSKGVNLCGWDDITNDFSARYSPCLFLPALTEGGTFSGSTTAQGTGNFATLTRMDYTMSLVDFGSATVPAGTFNGCATSKIEIAHFDDGDDTLEQGMLNITLCPGVGFAQISTSGLSIGAATTRLMSGVAGGSPIPIN